MLGTNHALYATAAWVGAWPYVTAVTGVDPSDTGLFAVSTFVAAGAGVIPDLDHPDARPSKHFGLLSRVVAKGLAEASGGHRLGTHSVAFAVMLGGFAWAATLMPDLWGRTAATAACAFCASVGLALVGPSLGFRVPTAAVLAAAALPGWFVYTQMARIGPLLPFLAAGGVLIHIACDAVTKGGVPVLWPFTGRRFALKLFRVGGPGENVATLVGVGLLAAAAWRVISPLAAS